MVRVGGRNSSEKVHEQDSLVCMSDGPSGFVTTDLIIISQLKQATDLLVQIL